MRLSGIVVACSLLVTGCSGSDSSSPSGPSPSGPASDAPSIPLEGAGSLVFRDGGALDDQRSAIERIVKEALSASRALIPLDGVTIVVEASLSNVIPELGFGGRAEPGMVLLAFDPNPDVRTRTLETRLLPLMAHELHHVTRLRTVGFPPNLLEAMILEGLADQFSIEVTGSEPPIWATALTGDALAGWTERSRAQWFDESYNHSAWFFGTSPAIPRWAGYSIGFGLTRDFFRANPSQTAAGLVSAPSTRFIS